MIKTLLGMVLVLAVFAGLLTALRLYRRNHQSHPETTRKLFHVSMGLFALALPTLFSSAWPVVILSALTIAAMIAMRRVEGLKKRLGSVICGVERRSFGEIYFPIGVGLVFYLSHGDRMLYSIPVLVLALADAAAAIVGIHFGKLRFRVTDGYKSVEGSMVFFAVAFLSTFLPLQAFGCAGCGESALIALVLSFLITVVEALSWRGLDNALIPLGAFFLLKAIVY